MFDDFIDTNIIIGSRIKWDRYHNNASGYMTKEGIKRCTSIRVYDECRNVFQKNRSLIIRYLKKFYDDIGGRQHNSLRIDQIIMSFTKKFIDKLDEEDQKVLNSFVKQNLIDIKNVLLGGENKLGDFRRDIIDAFNYADNSVIIDCTSDSHALIYRYDNCPKEYDNYYKDEYKKIYGIINHKDDTEILLDSYFIKDTHIKNNINFVTTDHIHILNNKPDIEFILPGINIMSP